MKIAVLGYGTVGKGVSDLLKARDTGIEIKKILRREGKATEALMTDKLSDILEDDEIDCVVETLAGAEPACTYILESLKAHKNVVTSNKAALAKNFPGIINTAKENNVKILFESSCGGGIPWLENIKKANRLDKITALSGILNGTCNYIIDRMIHEELEMPVILKDAQRLGFAEADPTADLSGSDIRSKSVITCSLAFNTFVPPDFPMCGIEKITLDVLKFFLSQEKSLRLMMFARRKDDRYAVGVAPIVLPLDAIEANVRLNNNCASLTGDFVGTLKFIGPGAGAFPTADAVVQDLVQLRDGTGIYPAFDSALTYDETLLSGTAFFTDGTKKSGTLASLCDFASKNDCFMAFEPEA